MEKKITLYYDFQGWPVNIMSLKDILINLGFKEENGQLSISSDDEMLNAYPCLLEDDGMAYGVNPKFVTSVGDEYYDIDVKSLDIIDTKPDLLELKACKTEKRIDVFNLFIDGEASDKYLDNFVKNYNGEEEKENNA